ncbi:MAG: hypothetical protein WBQ14_10990 [Gaiellaceae bacterium]
MIGAAIAENRRPPDQIRRGVYARFTMDTKTRRVTSLWIGRALER